MATAVADHSFLSSLAPAVIFVNASAGKGRGGALVSRIRKVFARHALAAEFAVTANEQELARGAQAALQAGRRLLIALGGDGTFQGLANATFGADAVLGVLPGGGGNDFAAALGFSNDLEAACDALLCGTPKRIDVARARTANGAERLYIGGGGMGIDAEAARIASGAFRYLPGRWRYVASALRALRGYRAVEVRAEFPGSALPTLEMKALVAAVLNTPSYGAGVRLAPDASVDDGQLNLVMVEEMSLLATLRLLPGLAKTGQLRHGRIERVCAQKIRLSTSRPCLFHGDGEILGPTPVEIEVAPQALRVLAPAQN